MEKIGEDIMIETPANEYGMKAREMEIDNKAEILNEEPNLGLVYITVYSGNSIVDEFYADDLRMGDNDYAAVMNGKPVAIIPKTYYIRLKYRD